MHTKAYKKTYYQDHRDILIERARLWRLEHEEQVKAKTECKCGGTYTYSNKRGHYRTAKHKAWFELWMDNNMNLQPQIV